ncbi:MAG TPA: 16S rRNA (guanine(527)-N(7))-methyltransferase RsmG [Verrucomicrobiae bacterium]|nr:16S rRNA (guanine(527)-N(7))-methyltransferase RsmG [Verrucomicrobiae bacterium]
MNQILSDTEIGRFLSPYGFEASPLFCEKLWTYVSLLQRWNSKISLTTVTDLAEIVKFHFGESLFAVSAVPIEESRLADVGSGAGFPGLPIAMAVPGLDLTLIESNARKCAFLSEVVRSIEVDRVTVFWGRMEELRAGPRKFDFITARALGHHDELLSWAVDHLADGGRVVLWLGEEGSHAISRDPSWNWRNRILIPGSQRRYLLVGSPKI